MSVILITRKITDCKQWKSFWIPNNYLIIIYWGLLTHFFGQEEQPHIQGAVAAWAQEGREELLHVQGQEGRWWEIAVVQGKE